MEDDLILGDEEGNEDEPYYPDYSAYIADAYNALQSVDMINPLSKADEARIKQTRSMSLYLIHKSISELVKQFDSEHD